MKLKFMITSLLSKVLNSGCGCQNGNSGDDMVAGYNSRSVTVAATETVYFLPFAVAECNSHSSIGSGDYPDLYVIT